MSKADESGTKRVRALLTKLRWSRRDTATVLGFAAGGFTVGKAWEYLEPLITLAFGGNVPERWKALGAWGFVIFLLGVLFVSFTVVSVRKLVAGSRLAQELDRMGRLQDPLVLLSDSTRTQRVAAAVLRSIPSSPSQALLVADMLATVTESDRSSAAGLLAFLRDLRLIEIDREMRATPCSEVAGCLARSIGVHLEEGVDLSAIVRSTLDSPDATRRIWELEERRVAQLRQRQQTPALVREVEVALILIKGSLSGQEVYLMQRSDTWTREGRYWFVGGRLEAADQRGGPLEERFRRGALRRLEDELQVLPADLPQPLLPLFRDGPAEDRRLSRRLGVYTCYRYQVFYAMLRADREEVRRLFQLESTLHTGSRASRRVERANRWLSWAEICAEPLLTKDMKPVLDRLAPHLDEIPTSGLVTDVPNL